MKKRWEVNSTEEAFIEPDADKLTEAVLAGNFIMCCDIEDITIGKTNLVTVYHYTPVQGQKIDSFEIYNVFEEDGKIKLRLENSLSGIGGLDKMVIWKFMDQEKYKYDLFMVDREHLLYTDILYDRYGGKREYWKEKH